MKYIAERKALLEGAAQRAEARAIAAEAEAARIKEEYAARIRAMFNTTEFRNDSADRAIRDLYSRMEEGKRIPFNNRSLAERVFAGPPPRGVPPARLPRPPGVVANGGRKQGKTRYVTKSRKARKRKYR